MYSNPNLTRETARAPDQGRSAPISGQAAGFTSLTPPPRLPVPQAPPPAFGGPVRTLPFIPGPPVGGGMPAPGLSPPAPPVAGSPGGGLPLLLPREGLPVGTGPQAGPGVGPGVPQLPPGVSLEQILPILQAMFA